MRFLRSYYIPTFSSLFSFCLVSIVRAQNVWEGDDAGSPSGWHVAENWSGDAVPNNMTDALVGAPAPTVIYTANAIVATLEVTVEGEIDIHGTRSLTVTGYSLVNDGVITVNADMSSSIATLNLGNQGIEIEGNGEIVLAAPGNFATLTNSLLPFVHGEDHTIRGEGVITALLVNNGTITAEDIKRDATAELLLLTGLKTNNGVIQSSPSGSLRSIANIDEGSIGRLIADTSPVILYGTAVAGGTLETKNGGVFQTSFNALTFDGVDELNGQINLVSGSGFTGNLVVRGGGFTNNGTILINRDNIGVSGLRFGESGTIDGTGEIILNAPGANSQISSDTAGAVGTFGPNQTV